MKQAKSKHHKNEGLKIVGNASDNVREKIIKSLGYSKIQEFENIIFCDYSEYDIKIEHIFTIIEDNKGNMQAPTNMKLKIITQEILKPLDYIPKGFKTICLFEYINGNIPDCINNLPVIEDWYQSDFSLYLI